MQKTLRQSLEQGLDSGFSTIEAFGEKVERQEYQWFPREEPAFLTMDTQHVTVRAFWDTGDPVNFSLSKPDSQGIKEAFSRIYATHLPDQQKENYQRHLPTQVKNVKMAIYDHDAGSVNVDEFNRLLEQVDEAMSMPPFPLLKLNRIHLVKSVTRNYIANSLGLDAKYIKSHFNLMLSVGLDDNRIDVSYNRVFFHQLDPLRLLSRAYNLLQSLAVTPAGSKSPVLALKEIPLILSPEASAFILKEFSHYFKIKADREMMKFRYPAILNIVDQPVMDGQVGSAPFDDEGVQTQGGETFLVKKGEFCGVISDIAAAFNNKKKSSTSMRARESTGNGFRNHRSPIPAARFSNLYIKPTVLPLKNLREAAGEGIVVSLVKLKHVDNRGYVFSAYGYRFQNHNMMEPVHFYFRTSFRSFLLNILKVSKEIKFFHSTYTIGSPYLLVKAGNNRDSVLEI
jgi:predicted Zn-dependent protease